MRTSIKCVEEAYKCLTSLSFDDHVRSTRVIGWLKVIAVLRFDVNVSIFEYGDKRETINHLSTCLRIFETKFFPTTGES
jgi:hypothetical protein